MYQLLVPALKSNNMENTQNGNNGLEHLSMSPEHPRGTVASTVTASLHCTLQGMEMQRNNSGAVQVLTRQKGKQT